LNILLLLLFFSLLIVLLYGTPMGHSKDVFLYLFIGLDLDEILFPYYPLTPRHLVFVLSWFWFCFWG